MSYHADKLVDGRMDGRTDGRTQATTIPEGQYWPRVMMKMWRVTEYWIDMTHIIQYIVPESAVGLVYFIVLVCIHIIDWVSD